MQDVVTSRKRKSLSSSSKVRVLRVKPQAHAEDIHDSRLRHQELTQEASPVHRLSQGVSLPEFLSF